ncbi:putative 7-deoxyloganetin glucosyltransferase [Helianthus debilis subsp. tardiflorus]
MEQHLQDERVKQLGSSLWKEDVSCIHWLDKKNPGSVVFVNFGSITVMTKEQLIEFGWGLANSNKNFLWIARPDSVGSTEAGMSPEFLLEIKGRGMITSWCPQEQVNSYNINRMYKYNKIKSNLAGKKRKVGTRKNVVASGNFICFFLFKSPYQNFIERA